MTKCEEKKVRESLRTHMITTEMGLPLVRSSVQTGMLYKMIIWQKYEILLCHFSSY